MTVLCQIRKVVFLKDKAQSPYTFSNPETYLSQRAIQRRIRYGIAIDSSDLPVNPLYLSQIGSLNNLRILGSSKWLNAVIIACDDAESLTTLNSFPIVQSLQNIALSTGAASRAKKDNFNTEQISPNRRTTRLQSDVLDYGASSAQIKIHNGHLLHNIGARGENMMIAFFDAGYNQYNNNRFTDSARIQGRIGAVRDFYNNDDQVSEDDAHGLYCLSVVAGNIPGEYIGSCPKAQYLLLRTEDVRSEQIIEEYMWGLGAEYADSCGADVFSSSVGYTTFDDPAQNHAYNELDGNTNIVTRMADKAASKGILVVTSAGNDGASNWKFIGSPGDGDSVFTVGAINLQREIAGFSSFGPTADGRVKPDAVSVGVATALIGTNQNIINANGTSFATPNIAGLISCLWQLFPELNNQELMQLVRASSDRYLSPDPQYGYGIPDMAKAIAIELQRKSNSEIQVNDCSVKIDWTSRDKKDMGYIIQRKFADEQAYLSLDTVFSNGAIWEERSYRYNDTFVTNNTSYRIIQLLDTAKTKPLFFTLDSMNISMPDLCENKQVILFPNPAKNNFQILFSPAFGKNDFQINIISSGGQRMKSVRFSKPYGTCATPAISLSGLSKGIYVVEISNNHKRLSAQKLIIR